MVLKRFIIPAVLMVAILVAACSGGDKPVTFNDNLDRVSYSIGYNLGMQIDQNMQSQNIELDADILSRAIKDALMKTEPAMSDSMMQAVMTNFQAEQEAEYMASVTENQKAASEFLANNAGEPGVIMLADSLQYSVITEGSGPSPAADDMVRVHYTGSFLDGTVFDSSVEGDPAEFPVTGVIPGWTRILQEMHVGDKWEIWIPPALAYGEQGYGSMIPPNSLLVFEVELLGIVDQSDSTGTE